MRIRCPHCREVVVVADSEAGEQKLCTTCKRVFTVPIPRHEAPDAHRTVEVAVRCPRCKADVAPGTAHCRRCHTDLATGRRLPLVRRLATMSPAWWTVVLGGLAAVGVLSVVSTHLVRRHYFTRDKQVTPFTRVERTPLQSEEWTERLLAAKTRDERRECTRRVLEMGPPAAPALAAALSASMEGAAGARRGAGREQTRNRIAAIHLLGELSDRDSLAVLERAEAQRELQAEALRARALLGDDRVVHSAASMWGQTVRRALFLRRLGEVGPASAALSPQAASALADSETLHWTQAVRKLQQPALDFVLNDYWNSWGWLGQHRGEGYARHIFALAQPGSGRRNASETVEEVRAARRMLEKAALDAGLPARAAAVLVLAQCTPQYKSLKDRGIAGLATALTSSSGAEQQRLVWTLAAATGRTFGEFSDKNAPSDVGATEIQAALAWARQNGVDTAAALPTIGGLPEPLTLVRRVVPPSRQLERDLLPAFDRDWPAVSVALDQWLDARLGLTPRLLERLAPGQRRPNPAGVAAAMLVAAATDAHASRPVLEIWRQASDQPTWLRALAFTALAAADARHDAWDSGWPAGLDGEALAQVPDDSPYWDVLARAVAAGGPAMRARLEKFSPSPLPPAVRTKLLRAAEEAAKKRGLVEKR